MPRFTGRLITTLGVGGLILATTALCAPARAADDLAEFGSNTGTILYLAASLAVPLLEDGKAGKNHMFRTADAGISSFLLSEGIKGLIKERRPDGSGNDSFPSAHAMTAFSVATVASQYHPSQAPYWYAGATFIAYSRVKLNKHTPWDVIAGAAFGYGTARLELSLKRGLILAPLIEPEHRTVGVTLTARF